MLGSKTRCRWRKKGLKTIIVRGKLPAGEATKAPPLGSTLGLYGVKADDFCTFYNKDSLRFYEKGLVIPFVVLISSTKAYIVEYKIPSVYTYITEFYSRFQLWVGAKPVFSTGKKRIKLPKLEEYAVRKKKRIEEFRDIFWARDLLGRKLLKRKKSIKNKKRKKREKLDSILSEFREKLALLRGSKARKRRKWKKGKKRSVRKVRMNVKRFREALYVICWMKSIRKENYFLRKWFIQILGSYDSCNFFDKDRFIKIDKWAFKKGGKKHVKKRKKRLRSDEKKRKNKKKKLKKTLKEYLRKNKSYDVIKRKRRKRKIIRSNIKIIRKFQRRKLKVIKYIRLWRWDLKHRIFQKGSKVLVKHLKKKFVAFRRKKFVKNYLSMLGLRKLMCVTSIVVYSTLVIDFWRIIDVYI